MTIGAQERDQTIFMESIPGPSHSNLISIETLKNGSVHYSNQTLTNPLGPTLLWMNLNGSTPTFNYLSLSILYPMVYFESSTLPYTSAMSLALDYNIVYEMKKYCVNISLFELTNITS